MISCIQLQFTMMKVWLALPTGETSWDRLGKPEILPIFIHWCNIDRIDLVHFKREDGGN